MSGLTLGLMSLDAMDLELLRRSGTAAEKAYAAAITPVLARPHWLLVTLVLANAACTEALPIVLDRLLDPVSAVILSIVVVLILGEIVPQSVCSRYGLVIGAHSARFVCALMLLTAPVSWPISKLLDAVLGPERQALFRRGQLKALVDLHSAAEGGHLSADECAVIRGALDLSSKTAADCLTPLDRVFMVPADAVLDEATLGSILASGHSRIPVHTPEDRSGIVGMLLAKELIMVDPARQRPVSSLQLRSLPHLRSDTFLYDILRLFETGRCHMAVLVNPSGGGGGGGGEAGGENGENGAAAHADGGNGAAPAAGVKTAVQGIVTIEDVLEELIQAEIQDETDPWLPGGATHAGYGYAHTRVGPLAAVGALARPRAGSAPGARPGLRLPASVPLSASRTATLPGSLSSLGGRRRGGRGSLNAPLLDRLNAADGGGDGGGGVPMLQRHSVGAAVLGGTFVPAPASPPPQG
jgi:metal transporter CNNM